MANRNLSYGSTGSDVKTLQKQLKSLGYYKTGSVDGSFGPLTKAAVKQFQRKAKITVDGIIGPQTRAALAKAIKNKNKKRRAQKEGDDHQKDDHAKGRQNFRKHQGGRRDEAAAGESVRFL